MNEQIKYILSEEQIPDKWYNIQSDLPLFITKGRVYADSFGLHTGTKRKAPLHLSVIHANGVKGPAFQKLC